MNPMSAQPTQPMRPQRLIVAITGATGAIYGVRLLQTLQRLPQIETHLIVSEAGWLTIAHELDMSKDAIRALAHTTHAVNNIGASIASGSFLCDGMIVAPCSMKTLSAIAHGYSDNLISRAADVILKERRRLTLMVRETPLSTIHLNNMLAVANAGGTIFPPVPAFYHQPSSMDEIIEQTVARVLDQHGIHSDTLKRWQSV
jgi:4-hydroxy-3-polyprenylbenzoate decarboxylase